MAVWLRNKLFDCGILSGEEFPVPVISVGNITVGGTGKTPHTEYLVQLFSDRAKVAVLSRGYKRKSSGFVLADSDANSLTLGDESYQIYRKFPHTLVAVDADRRRGIAKLLSLPEAEKPDIILLDDGYQHRYVKPSLSILLIDSNCLIYEDKLLPAGRLREPARNKSRADVVIVTKCPDSFAPIDYRVITKHLELFPYQTLYYTSFEYGKLIPVFKDMKMSEQTLDEIRMSGTKVLLLAGIASPQELIDKLKQYTNDLEILTFSDHHRFSGKDLLEIQQSFENISGKNKIIITTEKDAARLIDYPDLDSRMKNVLYYLPVTVVFNLGQEEIFIQKIEKHVKNIARNRILA
jgi:tetraacyldisaccharide 4'-kinase